MSVLDYAQFIQKSLAFYGASTDGQSRCRDGAERPSSQCCQTVFTQEWGKIAHVLAFLLKALLAHAKALQQERARS